MNIFTSPWCKCVVDILLLLAMRTKVNYLNRKILFKKKKTTNFVLYPAFNPPLSNINNEYRRVGHHEMGVGEKNRQNHHKFNTVATEAKKEKNR